MEACLAAVHRRQFFVPSAEQLTKHGNDLFEAVTNSHILPEHALPSRAQWAPFCAGRPVSLMSILKIDAALSAIAETGDRRLRETTLVAGSPFTLGPNAVIASVFYASPEELEEFRVRATSEKRASLSSVIFGPGKKGTLEMLERGAPEGHARVTWATVERIGGVLGHEAMHLFGPQPDRGQEAAKARRLTCLEGKHRFRRWRSNSGSLGDPERANTGHWLAARKRTSDAIAPETASAPTRLKSRSAFGRPDRA